MGDPSNKSAGDELRSRLARLGFPLERIGALILGCATLENDIEIVLWQLGEWPAPGAEPKTDRMPASERVAEFRRLAAAVADQSWPALRRHVDDFADAADNILAYRNAVAHGAAIGRFPGGGGGLSISNVPRNGEKRRRPIERADLDEPILEMVLEALFLLLQAIGEAHWQAQEELKLPALLQSGGLKRAKSLSVEARHIAELMNHEKY